jgi:deazaflavin-dependent oxidoreductase (nitroreductase family)
VSDAPAPDRWADTGITLPTVDPSRIKHWWTPTGKLLTVITRTLIALYRLTGGLIGSKMRGLPGILLTTTGARSGQPRTVHLPAIPDDDDLIVVASFAGGARNPAWYFNLVAHPVVTVQLRRDRYEADATRITATDELAAAWDLLAEQGPWYVGYQQGTERAIPIIRLRRRR